MVDAQGCSPYWSAAKHNKQVVQEGSHRRMAGDTDTFIKTKEKPRGFAERNGSRHY